MKGDAIAMRLQCCKKARNMKPSKSSKTLMMMKLPRHERRQFIRNGRKSQDEFLFKHYKVRSEREAKVHEKTKEAFWRSEIKLTMDDGGHLTIVNGTERLWTLREEHIEGLGKNISLNDMQN